MMAKIFAFLKRRWWVVLAAVVVGWGIYMFFTCYLWPDGNCTGFMGKTVWDVLQLLIIPVTLAVVAAYLDRLERKTDRENVKDNQREALLQSYIEFMTRLVLEKGLSESKEGDKVREIAQVKTETTYQQLDPKRNESLVKFLSRLGLVQGEYGGMEEGHDPIIMLVGINLKGVRFIELNLRGAVLIAAVLRDTKLIGIDFSGAILNHTSLAGADLSNTNLSYADLTCAKLNGAILIQANMQGTTLNNTSFDGARMPDGKEYDPKIHTVEMLTGHKKKLGVD